MTYYLIEPYYHLFDDDSIMENIHINKLDALREYYNTNSKRFSYILELDGSNYVIENEYSEFDSDGLIVEDFISEQLAIVSFDDICSNDFRLPQLAYILVIEKCHIM